MNGIVIGGSPSTGSSLLCALLSAHSKIYCGPETYLFAKPQLFRNWDKNKRRILNKGVSALRSPGWHLYNGVNLLRKENLWAAKELETSIKISQSFTEFYRKFFTKPLQANHCEIWVEKTPSNVYTYADLKAADPDITTIQTIRDPLDTIASLVFRGLPVYQAVGNCLVNTIAGFSVQNTPNHLIIRYEDLVTTPEKSISRVLSQVSLKWEPEILEKFQLAEDMDGWKHSPVSGITNKSIGRFKELDTMMQNRVLTYCELLKINPQFTFGKDTICKSIPDISKFFQYSYQNRIQPRRYSAVILEMLWDKIQRTARGYPTGFFNYPVKIR